MTNKILFIFAGWILLNAAAPALTISSVMGGNGADFDPWNQTRWSNWYQNGVLVEPFEMDMSVTFAARSEPWEIDITQVRPLSGSYPALFALNQNSSCVVDGNGVVIDVRKAYVRAWSLSYYYTNTVNTNTDYDNVDGILLWQTQASTENPSTVRNLTLKGFWRAISASHFHRGTVVLENLVLERNVWGLFPRGANVTVRTSAIRENVMGGFYGEYNSCNWVFEENLFRDNNTNGVISYGDVVLDACYHYTIRNNQFLPASYTPRTYHTAVSLYRNQGETGDIREHAAHDNVIENNYIERRNVAVDVAVRNGRPNNTIDMSLEGRCYADRNTVRSNTFKDCVIGIILRNNFNTVDSNQFISVQRPIVLHNVFYSMYHNTIINQSAATVWLWSVESDYAGFSQYLPYKNGLGGQIAKSEKFYHVISPTGTPNFSDPGSASLLVAETLAIPDVFDLDSDLQTGVSDLLIFAQRWLANSPAVIGYTRQTPDLDDSGRVDLEDLTISAESWLQSNSRLDAFGSNNKPIDIAVGDFAVYEPGDEIAVIFNREASQIDSTRYFTIVIYNQYGLELDRCGRSTVKWARIAAGNFLPDTGYIKENANEEIAAVPAVPNANGYYPIYIFRKGWAEPAVILAENNPLPIVDIAAGNFNVNGDEYDELAVKFSGTAALDFYKPSDLSWIRQATGVPSDVMGIASGDFDGVISNGSEVAAITYTSNPVFLYRVSQFGHYAMAAAANNWMLIAGGNFDGGLRARDEVAVVAASSANGIYQIEYYIANQTAPFKMTALSPLSVMPLALSAGGFLPSQGDPYNVSIGIDDAQLSSAVQTWGHHIAAIPDQPREGAIPAFWLNTNPADAQQSHYRLVPLLK